MHCFSQDTHEASIRWRFFTRKVLRVAIRDMMTMLPFLTFMFVCQTPETNLRSVTNIRSTPNRQHNIGFCTLHMRMLHLCQVGLNCALCSNVLFSCLILSPGSQHYDMGGFQLVVDYVQSDPYAAPSRFRVQVPTSASGFPKEVRIDIRTPSDFCANSCINPNFVIWRTRSQNVGIVFFCTFVAHDSIYFYVQGAGEGLGQWMRS